MRPVVLDTSVVLSAVLSPRGYRRRFWVVLALGALAARRDLLREEANALSSGPASAGGQVGGARLEVFAEQAEARYARLREALPEGCPDDWQLVASRPLLAEYERKLWEAGPRLDPSLREERPSCRWDSIQRQVTLKWSASCCLVAHCSGGRYSLSLPDIERDQSRSRA